MPETVGSVEVDLNAAMNCNQQQRKPLKDSAQPLFLLLLGCRLRSLCSLGMRSSLTV
jgi:hypothetical protein